MMNTKFPVVATPPYIYQKVTIKKSLCVFVDQQGNNVSVRYYQAQTSNLNLL